MNKKKHFGIHVGSSSILMIFVILCLVSFATLSIVSANADYKLSSKVADRTAAYYNACNEAEESIAGIDQVLHDLYESTADSVEYYDMVGTEKSYVISMSDLQSLQITLQILYPESVAGPYYSISSWQVITIGELDYDDSLNVLQ